MFCREFYIQRVYAFFVLFIWGKKCARANFYTFRMSVGSLRIDGDKAVDPGEDGQDTLDLKYLEYFICLKLQF